jgi:short-subunit dehydrogenase
LIYNAAALKTGGPLQLSAEDLVQDFRVNVAGALTAVQQVVIPMQSRKQGTILLTGGGLGLDPYPDYLSLSLGKAAIRNLALSLAKSFEPDGIHVATVTICGFIQPGTHFAPDLLAEEYWALHAQAPGSWQREVIYQ